VRTSDDGFRLFAEEAEPRLRRAFILSYGSDRGREATAEALAYGWEHWAKVRRMANPYGYLFRVGQPEAGGSGCRSSARLYRILG
jgi:hypothetical protein